MGRFWNKCKDKACEYYNGAQRGARNVDRVSEADAQEEETVELVHELVTKVHKLLSESQRPQKCPAAEKTAKELKTQLGELSAKYFEPLMEKMKDALKKLPEKVRNLFEEIMEEFKDFIEAKAMTLTQEDLQEFLTELKEKYEVPVREAMKNAKEFEMGAQDDETAEQHKNLEKLQNLMKQFEGKNQAQAMGLVTNPAFIGSVEGVLGKDVLRKGLKALIAAIDDIAKFVPIAQCAGLFKENL